MSGLPIVKMTLYKHGVGFYQRQGKVQQNVCTLTFRKEEMNDALKSLTVAATGEGQVAGLEYESPEDKAALLARSSIQLGDESALRDLLRDLRGRKIEIGAKGDLISGAVVGLDLPAEREPLGATLISVMLEGSGKIRPIQLGDVISLAIKDEKAQEDLRFVLRTSLADEDKRTITVRLTRPGAALSASYIAPSPVWRVSYRLVAEDVDGQGKGLLQGWGHFDNTLEEDLEGVRVKLVAGMPVSFVYDLYNPYTPPRPVVTEAGRTPAGPVEFEAAARAPTPKSMPMRALAAAPALESVAFAELSADSLNEATLVGASGEAQGDFFSYTVSEPVTVRRGQAAAVPILQTRLAYRKERLYNGTKQRLHPVIAARFTNDTGLTLERGPATVIDDGEYAGEAIVPFTRPGGEVFLAYAVDLGVRVTEQNPRSERVVSGVSLKDGYLLIEEYQIRSLTYRVENQNEAPVAVTIEHARLADHALYDTPEPAETTAEWHRFPVHMEAHSAAEFTVRQRQLVARREEVRNQKLDQLRGWLKNRALDEATFERLRGLLALYDRIGEHEARLKENDKQREAILNQQKAVQGNLTALHTEGEEGKLRARYAETLNALEDRLTELRADDAAQRQAIEALKRQIEAELRAL